MRCIIFITYNLCYNMHYYLYLSPLESSTGDKKYVGNDLWGMHKPKTLRVRENGNGARDIM